MKLNHTCWEDYKEAQRSYHSPKIAFKAVALAAFAKKKATTAVSCDTTRHNG